MSLNTQKGQNEEFSEEKPLHEIILDILYNADTSRPKALSPEDVFFVLRDVTISQKQINEVLEWLVAKGKVEKQTGKYWIDKIEFVERAGKNSEIEKLPLHEAILNILYYESPLKPAALTVEDVFFAIRDVNISETMIRETLEKLIVQKKVEKHNDTYWLDKYEFVERANMDIPQPVAIDVPVKNKPTKRIAIEPSLSFIEERKLVEKINELSAKVEVLEMCCSTVEKQQKNTRFLILIFLSFILLSVFIIKMFL